MVARSITVTPAAICSAGVGTPVAVTTTSSEAGGTAAGTGCAAAAAGKNKQASAILRMGGRLQAPRQSRDLKQGRLPACGSLSRCPGAPRPERARRLEAGRSPGSRFGPVQDPPTPPSHRNATAMASGMGLIKAPTVARAAAACTAFPFQPFRATDFSRRHSAAPPAPPHLPPRTKHVGNTSVTSSRARVWIPVKGGTPHANGEPRFWVDWSAALQAASSCRRAISACSYAAPAPMRR